MCQACLPAPFQRLFCPCHSSGHRDTEITDMGYCSHVLGIWTQLLRLVMQMLSRLSHLPSSGLDSFLVALRERDPYHSLLLGEITGLHTCDWGYLPFLFTVGPVLAARCCPPTFFGFCPISYLHFMYLLLIMCVHLCVDICMFRAGP